MTWILTTLRQQENFTDEQIIIIGLRLDDLTVDWISLVGREGMTNDTHLMTSGHIVYYLKYWRNFYRYSIATKGGNSLIRNTDIYIATERKMEDLPARMANQGQK
jgi:hypothetical protein